MLMPARQAAITYPSLDDSEFSLDDFLTILPYGFQFVKGAATCANPLNKIEI